MNYVNEQQRLPGTIRGDVASSGLGRGAALMCDCGQQPVVSRRRVPEAEVQREIERFDAAIAATEKKLVEIQENVRKAFGEAEAGIFHAQVLLLRDPQLRESVCRLCTEKRINAEAAIDEAIRKLKASFERLDDPFFRERAADLPDVGKRLLDHLGEKASELPVFPEGCVVVTNELLSSMVTHLEGSGVRGLIVEKGGLTSHATILVRSLGIPMLVHTSDATRRIRAGDLVVVDALGGRALINPRPEILQKYEQLESDLQSHLSSLRSLIGQPAITLDGVSIKLAANIGQSAGAAAAANVKAESCGLYRTEFMFVIQDHLPTEEEQYQLYRIAAEYFAPGETVIRVLDIGSDKSLSYLPLPPETNPALGRRGTRLLLAHPEIFRTQLRAILRVSASRPVSLLFPMIDGLDDLRAAKVVIERVKCELREEGIQFNPDIQVGVMIETPSAVVLFEELAREADFFNVGTNDLVQYMLAADRTSDDPDSAYEPLHPAILRVLAKLAKDAAGKTKPLCLCGETASDPAYTALLMGLGFRSFSVSPGRLLEVKHVIRSTGVPEAEELAEKALSLSSTREIKALIQEDWSRRIPVSPIPLDAEPVG